MIRDRTLNPRNVFIIICLVPYLLACSSGCAIVGLASVMMYAWKGQVVPARYDGLEGKRVAVVCLSDTNMYAGELSLAVEQLLKRKVSDIEVIPHATAK